MKYVLVTGGVLSGIGKGVIASSIGILMKSMNLRVTSIKIDPYINIDAGTMSPFEHGEVFVLDDGGEVDLDLGNYERFIGTKLTKDNNITTGKIYNSVIEKERRGEYLGKTVQVVPHITNEIQAWVERVASYPVDSTSNLPDICVIELGGTIGDIESMPFVEAMRQFQFRVGRDNFCSVHVSLVPVVGAVGEQKSKPTQQSVRELRALGLSPDVIICRSTQPLSAAVKEKISLFCHVAPENVLSVHDVSNIYRVPLILNSPQGLPSLILQKLKIHTTSDIDLAKWSKLADTNDILSNQNPIHIALVGKYTNLSDAYLSVINALQHAALAVEEKLTIDWIEASHLEPQTKQSDPDTYQSSWKILQSAHGILVPGGFGDRGIEGKILACNYARTHNIPYLGICLGLQIAVIEICRNVLGWNDANSAEFSESASPQVIVYMPEISKTQMGGTMRLGKRTTVFRDKHSVICKLYGGVERVDERHRHRYEVNPELAPEIEAKSHLRFVAQDETGKRMEIIEMGGGHPYFVGVQYHPEFLTRPMKPSPPFHGLLLAASNKLQTWLTSK